MNAMTKVGDLSWYAPNTLCIAGFYGQSNIGSLNKDTGDAILSPAAMAPTRALMVAGGPHVFGPTWADLVPLVEAVCDGQRETPCSGFANNLIAKVQTAFGFQPYVAVVNAAKSSQKIAMLNRGSDQYEFLLAGVRDAVAHAVKYGLVPRYIGTFWGQGEAEVAKCQTLGHARKLKQISRQIATDMRLITGQADDPIFFTTQIATGGSRDLWDATWMPDAPGLALYETDGDDLIRLAGPMYQFQISSDGRHLACGGQYLHGAQFAEAAFGEIAKGGWHPIKCVNGWRRSSTVIRLEFAVPDDGDLALITNEAVADTIDSFKGFQACKASGAALTITSVAVPASPDPVNIAARFVDIALSTAYNGSVRVAYAHRRDGANSGNGPVVGMRGLLATVDKYPTLACGEQRHWCPAFIREIPGS